MAGTETQRLLWAGAILGVAGYTLLDLLPLVVAPFAAALALNAAVMLTARWLDRGTG